MPKAIKESLIEWNDGKGTAMHPKRVYMDTASTDHQKDDVFWIYTASASKDQQKDHPKQSYNHGALKDQQKDDVFWIYTSSASKDRQKDYHKQSYNHDALKDQQKDDIFWIYTSSASKDQRKDHPEQSYNRGALKDQQKDDVFWIYTSSASYNHGALKNRLKHDLFQWFALNPAKDEPKDDQNAALFFFQNDLDQGTEMNLHFTKNSQKSVFLPRKVALSIPFSTNNLPQIYNHFSIKPDSIKAEAMKQTLKVCEKNGIEGEEKYCATSLESMIDFVTTQLGHKVKAISTEVNAKESIPLQKYKIEFARKLDANQAVICHRQSYAYAVFYCHKTVGTEAYVVSVAGVDGVKVNAVAVCHTDTTKWNLKHLAFQMLKVKPGSVPVCHFVPEDHVVWIPY